MNSKHYIPQRPGTPPERLDGPGYKFYPATPGHCGIVTRTRLRTHARNAIEINIPGWEGAVA